jgi:thiol:disulfide interchange protein/DsbC/DsbD-like thiol-disulfide interchange protein
VISFDFKIWAPVAYKPSLKSTGALSFLPIDSIYVYLSAMRGLWFLMLGIWGLAGMEAPAQFGLDSQPHTQAQLLLAADTARPGATLLAAVRLTLDPGWHVYWRNPGDAGTATQIKWSLPAGVTAGEIQWPVPEKLADLGFVNYVYSHETLLLVPLTLASNAAVGELQLAAQVDWLECEKSCVPGSAQVSARLAIGARETASTNAALIAQWQGRLPAATQPFPVLAHWEAGTNAETRFLALRWPLASAPTNADFFPYANPALEMQGGATGVPVVDGQAGLRLEVKKTGAAWPQTIAGVFALPGAERNGGFQLALAPTLAGESANPASGTNAASGATLNGGATPLAQPSLLLMLAYAFIGGLILNIMPCVLPVIAIKILSFVNQSRSDPRQIRKLGLVYAAGVLTSFLALAALAIAVKTTGRQAGWGMQFGNPEFLVALTLLVTLVALNLFGVFEVFLGGGVMTAAGELTAKEGPAGAFFNGVLATVLATPCTAPFLSIALGFAFAQPAWSLTLFMLTVGLGLAAPYVLLCWRPAWLKFLPKPGLWMQQFKIAMGFPMLATAFWLFTLTIRFYGQRVLWLGFFLVAVALALWVYGEFAQRGRKRRSLAVAIAVGLAGFGYAYALEDQMRWRSPASGETPSNSLQESPEGIAWEPWNPAAVTRARAAGRPVFVDFTADWCATCQVNKKLSIEIASVRAKLKELNAVTLLGDYTTIPPLITAELRKFNRAGVPLVLVYPKRPDAAPLVLPEALTPGIVLSALERAGQ